MDDEAGLNFTLDSIRASLDFCKAECSVEVIVVDGNGRSSSSLTERYAGAAGRMRLRQIEDLGAGPYGAVDAGLRAGRGRIQSWINAGDYLFPQTIALVLRAFSSIDRVRWLCGSSCLMTEAGLIGRIDAKPVLYPRAYIAAGWYRKGMLGYLQQEGMFWDSRLYEEAGGLDLRYKLAADYALWTRFARIAELKSIVSPLAAFEVAPGTQRSRIYEAEYLREVDEIASRSVVAGVFSFLLRVHYSLVVLARLAFIARGDVVLVDTESGRLASVRGFWPASRVSLWRLAASVRRTRLF